MFAFCGKHGSAAAGLVSSYALALSLGLEHCVPLADLLRPGLGQSFAPSGHTDDPEIPRVCSAVDYPADRERPAAGPGSPGQPPAVKVNILSAAMRAPTASS